MRKIDPHDFRIATRSTSREINRRIALNLVREHQPISRADLARRMKVRRGIISVLVGGLIAEGLIYEGVTGGIGLATVINAINPDCVYVGGEITAAWGLIESNVREALVERAITDASARTPVHMVGAVEHPRLRGAAALAAPTFAAPRVA